MNSRSMSLLLNIPHMESWWSLHYEQRKLLKIVISLNYKDRNTVIRIGQLEAPTSRYLRQVVILLDRLAISDKVMGLVLVKVPLNHHQASKVPIGATVNDFSVKDVVDIIIESAIGVHRLLPLQASWTFQKKLF